MGLWRSLRKDWDVVRSRLFFVVENGQRVKFWKDFWCGNEPLCVSFPFLFALAVFKDAWVKDVWCSNEGGGSWYRLMTGSWMRFVDFFWPYTGREFSKRWMIG